MTTRDYILAVWLSAALLPAAVTFKPGAGIVIDSQGQVYFSDTGAGIWKIDTGGKLTLISKQHYRWIALDPNGQFSNTKNTEWHHISPSGGEPAMLGSNDRPIAVSSDGNLYHAACHYSGPLLIVREVPKHDSFVLADVPADGYTTRMCPVGGVAIGPDGSVYFSEPQTVTKVTSKGASSVLARPADLPDCSPVPGIAEGLRPFLNGLDVDADGAVYVAASACSALLKIQPDGKVSTILKTESPWSPTAVAVSGRDLYVLEYQYNAGEKRSLPRVRKIAPNGSATVVATVSR